VKQPPPMPPQPGEFWLCENIFILWSVWWSSLKTNSPRGPLLFVDCPINCLHQKLMNPVEACIQYYAYTVKHEKFVNIYFCDSFNK
jgi:hypothetical protein